MVSKLDGDNSSVVTTPITNPENLDNVSNGGSFDGQFDRGGDGYPGYDAPGYLGDYLLRPERDRPVPTNEPTPANTPAPVAPVAPAAPAASQGKTYYTLNEDNVVEETEYLNAQEGVKLPLGLFVSEVPIPECEQDEVILFKDGRFVKAKNTLGSLYYDADEKVQVGDKYDLVLKDGETWDDKPDGFYKLEGGAWVIDEEAVLESKFEDVEKIVYAYIHKSVKAKSTLDTIDSAPRYEALTESPLNGVSIDLLKFNDKVREEARKIKVKIKQGESFSEERIKSSLSTYGGRSYTLAEVEAGRRS